MLGLFLCRTCFECFGSTVGLGWSCGERCFDHAMERGDIDISIFGGWCYYDPIGIGV